MIRIFTSRTQKTGEAGEEIAVQYLKKSGFSIIERNIANKFGEIDIVAKKGSMYYFIEVKAGRGTLFAKENLHSAKLQKFFKSVEYFRFSHKEIGEAYKISAIFVDVTKGESGCEFIEEL